MAQVTDSARNSRRHGWPTNDELGDDSSDRFGEELGDGSGDRHGEEPCDGQAEKLGEERGHDAGDQLGDELGGGTTATALVTNTATSSEMVRVTDSARNSVRRGTRRRPR